MDKIKKGCIRKGSSFSESERHELIKEYLSGTSSKTAVWRKYTGQNKEHGTILNWMRMYGYEDARMRKSFIFEPLNTPELEKGNDDLNTEELQARIKKLEQLLEDSQLKQEGYRLMIELTEKEYKIPIVKKLPTK